MKRVLLAGIGVLALAAGLVSAQAADLRRPAPIAKAPVYVEPAFTWTGFYVGLNGGYAWGRSDFNGPFGTGGYSTEGGLFGVTAGYNWQVNQFVVGVEGDLDWANIRGAAPCGATVCSMRTGWLGTLRGRVGYAFDRFMPYVTGGLAAGDIRSTITGVGTASQTNLGWTLGAGVEAALMRNWSAKVEYLYVDLGRGAAVAGTGSAATSRNNIVRVGLNYRF